MRGESIFEVLVERWRFDWEEVQLELMEVEEGECDDVSRGN
jgi:hypothetical protein